MQINFFTWIRQGVRQSVLMGVADAVDDLGVQEHDAKYSKSIRDAVKQSAAEFSLADGRAPNTRRRLGKSLRDIDSGKA